MSWMILLSSLLSIKLSGRRGISHFAERGALCFIQSSIASLAIAIAFSLSGKNIISSHETFVGIALLPFPLSLSSLFTPMLIAPFTIAAHVLLGILSRRYSILQVG